MNARGHNPADAPTVAGSIAVSEPAEVLIVGGDPDCRMSLVTMLHRRRHRCTQVHRLDEARDAIAHHRYDLILLNPDLPDGDGLQLAALVQQISPSTKTVVFSDAGSFKSALRAMRSGAVDFINTPLDLDELVDRIDAALRKSQEEVQRDQRIRRLQRICRELNVARDEIAEQVDTLCNDLISAYRDLTEQLKDVALATEFRTLLRMELDVEEVLRTTLEYLLGKTGPTNAAVFLPDSTGRYGLGAYVNYDCPRESIDTLLEHLCEAICPQMAEEPDIVAFDDADEFAEWIGIEDGGFLADSQIIAMTCEHEGEPKAILVLFRSRSKPFDPKLATSLDIIRTAFAEQLTRLVRVHHRFDAQWPNDAATDERDFDDEFGFGDGLAA